MSALTRSIAFVFLGCGINNISLELLVKADPSIGNSITALQFLFISLASFCSRTSLTTSSIAIEKRQLPARFYAKITLAFVTVSVINNVVFMFNISLPFHMVFRSCSLVVNMALGLFLFKRMYTRLQIVSCLLITVGVLIATFADSLLQTRCCEVDPAAVRGPVRSGTYGTGIVPWLIGVALLLLSLLLSSALGHWQESGYRQYGRYPQETLFYSHFFSLPLFLFLAPDILVHLPAMLGREPDVVAPFVGVPIPYAYITAVNVVSQYLCIHAVYTITSLSNTLTCTFTLTVRKFMSLLVSAVFMGNDLTTYHWVGAGFVFLGTILYFSGGRQAAHRTGPESINRKKQI